jgi:hypothetical protein
VELHAQAAARTLRAVVAPEAPLRAALLLRGAAGRGGSPGEAARPWRRLRLLERGGGGAEARAGGRAAAAQLSAPARALHSGAAVQQTRGGGKGDWCADGGQRRNFPPTHCPPPAEPPSAALPAQLAYPTQGPAATRCRSAAAGRPPAPAAADIRTVLWSVADTVRALAAGAAIGAKALPAEGD